jgi:uncharacterized RDD family membrane protein YckC
VITSDSQPTTQLEHVDLLGQQDPPGQQDPLGQWDLVGQLDPLGQQDPLGQPAAIRPEDPPFGRRVAAALVDLALLSGLFLILSLVVGQTSHRVGPFGISLSLFSVTVNGHPIADIGLNGAWVVLYLALLPTYFFALEALAGQTVGKCLLGLRVQRADGSRPSVAAIAGRTLLRPIDWLPVLYLAGFITMLVTGSRRRRLGDLAAGTAVVRAQHARHRGLAVLPLAIVLVATAGLSVYRVTSAWGTSAYRAHGVSFDYPAGWQQGNLPVRAWLGHVRQNLWNTAVVLDQADWIDVAAYRLRSPAPQIPIGPLPPAATTVFRRYLGQGGLTLQAGPTEITMGGLRGFLVQGAGTQAGIPIEDTLAFVFNGTAEFVVFCEHARAQGAGEVEHACSQVMRSFTVTNVAAAAGTVQLHSVSFSYPAGWQEESAAASVPVEPAYRQLWNPAVAVNGQAWIRAAAGAGVGQARAVRRRVCPVTGDAMNQASHAWVR